MTTSNDEADGRTRSRLRRGSESRTGASPSSTTAGETLRRVAVLWRNPASYIFTGIDALRTVVDEVLLVHAPDSPLTMQMALTQETAGLLVESVNRDDASRVTSLLKSFAPDGVLVCSWNVPAYRGALSSLSRGVPRALYMDNTWHGTIRQWGGVAASSMYLHRLFDTAFVPGERQVAFARRLGFDRSEIYSGALSADHTVFGRPARTSGHHGGGFVFCGRLAPEKGVDLLLDAYRQYRDTTGAAAWPLTIVGSGPLEGALRTQAAGVTGVAFTGFKQSTELAEILHANRCFVLPSHFEPWGVVVHEAAIAGLPVICSDAVGASTHLVQDRYNGRVFARGSSAELVNALRWISSTDQLDLVRMGERSQQLSQQFTPQRWASTLIEALGARR